MEQKTNDCAVQHFTEIVLFDLDVSREAHIELYRFGQERYLSCGAAPVEFLQSLDTKSGKLHLALLWKRMLGIALWNDSFSTSFAFQLLKGVGLSDKDLNPFRDSGVNDIFPALYYGRNFDALRRICNLAKRVAEDKMRNRFTKVDCHLVSSDVRKIVASSL